MKWTEREMAILVEQWSQGSTASQIAVMVNRSLLSVDKKVELLRKAGIILPHHHSRGLKKERMIRLHSLGYNDRQLAQALMVPVTSAAKMRLELGLKPNPPDPDRRRESYRKMFEEQGPLVLRRKHHQEAETFDMGWPIGCTRAMARVLEGLLNGPQTTYQLAEWVRRDPTCVRKLLHQIARRGWVLRNGSRRDVVWWLVPKVRAGRLQVLAEERGMVV